MRLHLVIPRNDLRVARRRRTAVARASSSSITTAAGSALLLRLVLVLVVLLGRGPRGAVVHVARRLGRLGVGALLRLVSLGALLLRLAVAAVVDEDVDAAVLRVLRDVLVVVVVGRLGVFGDDVPGVEEAGNVAEDEKEDVDDRVGGADAALYPDCL